MKIGLFIGRFQPFHNAHLEDIKIILKECDEVIIGIGSSQESNTKDNPFSYEERKGMIEAALKSNNIKNFEIFGIPDFFDDEKWIGFIKNDAKFDVVYSGNPVVVNCFSSRGVRTKKIELIKGINSTDIRNKISNGQEWKHLVPKEIIEFIEKINSIERIKALYRE